jgi:D-alanine-D-alanine ligase
MTKLPSFCKQNALGRMEVSREARIAVLAGGLSAEAEVSRRSGSNCLKALHRLGFSNAYLLEADRRLPQALSTQRPDVVFLALHGTYGEDGAVQGLLEWLDLPYTGNRLAASAITMDKGLTKRLLAEAGLAVLPSWVLSVAQSTQQQEALLAQVTVPCMVKPATQGSSVGMSRVESAPELKKAVALAFSVDKQVLIEPYIKGRDLTVGVLWKDGQHQVTPILELRCPNAGWYTLEAKYTAGETEFLLPAPVSEAVTQQVQEMALKAHESLGCFGVSRTDFILTPDESAFYLLEVNSIPGMTDLSDLPAQCQAMGVSYDELVEALLHSAVQVPGFATASAGAPEKVTA